MGQEALLNAAPGLSRAADSPGMAAGPGMSGYFGSNQASESKYRSNSINKNIKRIANAAAPVFTGPQWTR
jgi:hypothetical protein